jgi:ABC-type antimicrobial peptide transport system permease subunit
VLVRAARPVDGIERDIARAVQSIDRALPPPAFQTMNSLLAEDAAPRQFTFVLLGAFAALAAILAIVGLYGVLTHLVAERTREIGIRVALGADPSKVTRLILSQGVILAILGATIGLGASMLAVRAVRSLLYDTSVYDPWIFAAVVAMLVAVATVASWIPARRASRVDPVLALRAE